MEQENIWFGSYGAVRGVLGETLFPEGMVRLGAVLALEGRVGLGYSDTPAARMLAQAAAAGVTAAGGDGVCHAMECSVQGAWIAKRSEWPVSLFVEEGNQAVYLHLFDRQGLHLDREREQILVQSLAEGGPKWASARDVGQLRRSSLTGKQWAEETARNAALGHPTLRRVSAAVEGDAPEDQAVREALVALGCQVEEQWRPGIPAFQADRGGYRLRVRDERGALLESGQVLALIALIEMENGGGRVAVPAEATAAVDVVAAGYRGTVLRLDRDGQKARDLYAALPWLWSAPAAAVRICSRMGVSGQRLETLSGKIPRFHTWQREVLMETERSRILKELAREHGTATRGEGLRLRYGGGWIWLAPTGRDFIRVMAEDRDMETAAELCDFYIGRILDLDREAGREKTDGK